MSRRRAGAMPVGAAALRAGAAAVVATASLAVLFAPSAGAIDAPEIVIDSPGGGAVLGQPTATISGHATMHQFAGLQANRVMSVVITLSSAKHPGPLPSCDSCWSGEAFSASFSWTTPALAWNGPYSFSVSARGREGPVDLNGDETSGPVSRGFSLAVPPAPPKGVTTTVNPDRTVTVSWSKNPEPDLIGYRVQRQEPGSNDWPNVGELTKEPTIHDPFPAGGDGGGYVYRVLAIRPGADGTVGTAVLSNFAGADAAVPNRAGDPVAPNGDPAAPGGAAGAAGVGAGAPPDLRGILGGGGGGGLKSSGVSLPQLPGTPDTGFDTNLPYGDQKRRGSQGAVETITMGAAGLASNPRALAVPLAAGLVLFMTSFHLRLAQPPNGRSEPRPAVGCRVPRTNQGGNPHGSGARGHRTRRLRRAQRARRGRRVHGAEVP